MSDTIGDDGWVASKAEELEDRLSRVLREPDSEDQTRDFYVNSDIENLYQRNDILQLIGRSPENASRSSIDCASAVLADKTHILTVMLNCRFKDKKQIGTTLRNFVDKDIADRDLPFKRCACSGSKNKNFKLCAPNRMEGDHDHCVCKLTQDWSDAETKSFAGVQWKAQAAVFWKQTNDVIPQFVFENSVVLPFVESYETRTNSQLSHTGGFGHVWAVRIAAGHQNLHQSLENDDEPLLAVKRLQFGIEDFRRETEMLFSPIIGQHHYITNLLATYEHKAQYHLLFPFAQTDLRRFWTTERASKDKFSTYWLLDQITGLASALEAIHNHKSSQAFLSDDAGRTRFRTQVQGIQLAPGEEGKYGRHGDIKPANVLWRSDLGGSAGRLQLADLGLGKFHGVESRSRVDPRRINGSSTYMPPEIELGQVVSRKYDIWSFGCVVLEFLIWAVAGQTALNEFHNARLATTYDDRVEDDTYYTLVKLPDGSTTATVRSAVSHWVSRLPERPGCPNSLAKVARLVESKMIIITPAGRAPALELYQEFRQILKDHQE